MEINYAVSRAAMYHTSIVSPLTPKSDQCFKSINGLFSSVNSAKLRISKPKSNQMHGNEGYYSFQISQRDLILSILSIPLIIHLIINVY